MIINIIRPIMTDNAQGIILDSRNTMLILMNMIATRNTDHCIKGRLISSISSKMTVY